MIARPRQPAIVLKRVEHPFGERCAGCEWSPNDGTFTGIANSRTTRRRRSLEPSGVGPRRLVTRTDDGYFAARPSESRIQSVVLHYRPLNQTLDWKQLPMEKTADRQFQGTVPSKDILSRYDFQYFVEVLTSDGGRRFPSYLDGQPYFVTRVRHP